MNDKDGRLRVAVFFASPTRLSDQSIDQPSCPLLAESGLGYRLRSGGKRLQSSRVDASSANALALTHCAWRRGQAQRPSSDRQISPTRLAGGALWASATGARQTSQAARGSEQRHLPPRASSASGRAPQKGLSNTRRRLGLDARALFISKPWEDRHTCYNACLPTAATRLDQQRIDLRQGRRRIADSCRFFD